MKLLPKARTADIVTQNLKTEVLIYDLKTNQAFCLNETLAKVFNACDGQTPLESLKRASHFTDDLIHLALAELEANELLEDYANDHFAGMSRREVVRRVGLASMIALPLIAGITAPVAADAASGVCATINACIKGNSAPYCPTGCTSTVTVITYASSDGSCTNPLTQGSTFDCTPFQGFVITRDTRRIA